MIEWIVGWAVRHEKLVPAVVILAAIGAGLAGAWLRFDALPDATGKQVVVITRAPGLTPEEVERLVTRPVELSLGGVPRLRSQRSVSRYGLSSVTAVFEEGTDLLEARQLVQERLRGVSGQMPPGVEAPELGPLTGGLGEIYQFTLSSPERTPAELQELMTLRVAPLLASVPGVVEVNSWGGERRTLDVVADPTRMARREVTLEALAGAVREATGQVPGARVETGRAGVLLRGVSWPRDPSELAAAVVRTDADGTAVRIGDVADVEPGALPRIGAATADGRGETLYVMVQMLLDANALEVLERVHERMDEVREVLPEDVTVREVYDRSELVNATLETVFTNLLEGGLLVVVVLFLMLGSFRAGALVASIIPLSMLGAVTGMVLFDVPGNLMSLGALDFGLLVDGGVVMVEAVFHATHARGGPIGDRVRESTRAMARPVFYSVLIILLVYVPILSLTGVEGRMFRPMAITVVLALLSALILSLTFVPAASRLILREEDVPERPPWLVRIAERAYRPILDLALSRPWWVAATAVVLLGVGGALFTRAGTAFVPQLDEGDLVVQTTRASDISVQAAVADSSRMEAAILEVPEVRHVASRIGSPAVATDVMGLEQADVFIDVAPRDRWRDGLSREALISEIEAAIEASAPADEVAFTQPIQMRFNELVGGSVTDVSVSVFGEDLTASRAWAEEATGAIEGIEGAHDVRILAPPEVALLEVRPRPLDAARQRMRPAEVLTHVQALRSGVTAGETYDGPLRIPVRVRLGAEVDALSLARTPVPSDDGSLVPLSRVAEVERRHTPSLVNREMAQRRVVIGFNVRGRDLGSVVEDARTTLSGLERPEGARLEWGGQYESLESAQQRLLIVIPTVLGLILALLLVLFRSLRPALIILLNVPFAAVGGAIALTVRDLPISISAAIGFIALSGIATLNGVVLVSSLLEERAAGHDLREAARRAAHARMRPVLMTALVAALGFVPMMLATGVGAEVQRPLATVVVGGLVTSTFLTLVILPAIFPWIGGRALAGSASPGVADTTPDGPGGP
ncbi:MAG TPA: CusA/CzcA family heavy metal efflux RND transporter [Sandaracinaceae bacterium LLY-WYZ-13_1]|nr:CusA/CzcA family heavy metal efflux RND transporter [Sandaracinaceae bacterium LLY-WYZ-13_1]